MIKHELLSLKNKLTMLKKYSIVQKNEQHNVNKIYIEKIYQWKILWFFCSISPCKPFTSILSSFCLPFIALAFTKSFRASKSDFVSPSNDYLVLSYSDDSHVLINSFSFSSYSFSSFSKTFLFFCETFADSFAVFYKLAFKNHLDLFPTF